MIFTSMHASQSLETTRAFTTLSLVMLLTGLAGNLIHAVPLFQTALASVDRNQAFPKLGEIQKPVASVKVNPPSLHRAYRGNAEDENAIELEAASAVSNKHSMLPHGQPDITLASVSISLGTESKDVLHNISIEVPEASLTSIIGSVGRGKTTLLRTLVGDVPVSAGHVRQGAQSVTSAYCAQTPWLPSGTVSSLIVGPNIMDELWLLAVIKTCALEIDLAPFHNGLQTIIGSNGATLSGGQRQRLALARALYARQSPLVVDDALSGLDANTSSHVFLEVFGPSGFCRVHKITAIVVTNDTRHLCEADHIVIFGSNGHVLEQGGLEKIEHVKGHTQSKTRASDGTPREQAVTEATLKVGHQAAPSAKDDTQHDLTRRTGDIAVYWYYARSMGWLYGTLLLFTTLTFALGLKFGDVWVQWGSDHNIDLSLGASMDQHLRNAGLHRTGV